MEALRWDYLSERAWSVIYAHNISIIQQQTKIDYVIQKSSRIASEAMAFMLISEVNALSEIRGLVVRGPRATLTAHFH